MQIYTCSHCQTPNPTTNRYCLSCKKPLRPYKKRYPDLTYADITTLASQFPKMSGSVSSSFTASLLVRIIIIAVSTSIIFFALTSGYSQKTLGASLAPTLGKTPTPITAAVPTPFPFSTPTPTDTPTPTPTDTPTPTPSPVDPTLMSYVGIWQNVDPATRSWVRVEITAQGNTLVAHFLGACIPTPCDAGSASALFTGDPVYLHLDDSFATRDFTLSLAEDVLSVTTFTHFTDDSGRSDYTTQDDFYQ